MEKGKNSIVIVSLGVYGPTVLERVELNLVRDSTGPRLVHSLSHEYDVDKQRGTHHRLSIFTQLQKKRKGKSVKRKERQINTVRLSGWD